METVSENISAESYYETDIEENESDLDPDYYPSSDGSESENFWVFGRGKKNKTYLRWNSILGI